MTFHGADTEALTDLATAVEEAGRRLDEIASRLGPRVLSAPWDGADADGFRDLWLSGPRLRLARGTERLLGAGRGLRAQAEEQELTSGTRTGAGPDLIVGGEQTGAASATDVEAGPVTVSGGEDGEGGTSGSVSGTDRHEIEVENGPVTGSLFSENTVQVAHAVAAEGSETYTLEATLQVGGSVGADGGRWGAEYGFDDGTTYTYSVELPEGADVNPLDIDPADPSTLPPGASVTIDLDQFHGDTFSAEYRELRAELGVTETDGLSTIIQAHDDGTVSLDSGPTSSLESAVRIGVGIDEVNAGIANTWTQGNERFEHADFDLSTPEGTAAYEDAMVRGVYPDGNGPGVSDRYTTTHTTSDTERGTYLTIDAGPVSLEHNSMTNEFSDRLVVRDYPDGSQNFEQVIYTHGTAVGEHTSVTGGTDRETSYSMHVIPSSSQEVDSFSTYYPEHKLEEGRPFQISFTPEEVEMLATNHAQNNPGVTVTSAETYVSRMLAASNNMGPDWMLPDLANDNAGFRDPETGVWHPSGHEGMPGTVR